MFSYAYAQAGQFQHATGGNHYGYGYAATPTYHKPAPRPIFLPRPQQTYAPTFWSPRNTFIQNNYFFPQPFHYIPQYEKPTCDKREPIRRFPRIDYKPYEKPIDRYPTCTTGRCDDVDLRDGSRWWLDRPYDGSDRNNYGRYGDLLGTLDPRVGRLLGRPLIQGPLPADDTRPSDRVTRNLTQRYYYNIVGRGPTNNEISSALNLSSPRLLARNLFGSAEFTNGFGNEPVERSANRLYKSAFGRDASASEIDTVRQDRLRGKSWVDIVDALYNSAAYTSQID